MRGRGLASAQSLSSKARNPVQQTGRPSPPSSPDSWEREQTWTTLSSDTGHPSPSLMAPRTAGSPPSWLPGSTVKRPHTGAPPSGHHISSCHGKTGTAPSLYPHGKPWRHGWGRTLAMAPLPCPTLPTLRDGTSVCLPPPRSGHSSKDGLNSGHPDQVGGLWKHEATQV